MVMSKQQEFNEVLTDLATATRALILGQEYKEISNPEEDGSTLYGITEDIKQYSVYSVSPRNYISPAWTENKGVWTYTYQYPKIDGDSNMIEGIDIFCVNDVPFKEVYYNAEFGNEWGDQSIHSFICHERFSKYNYSRISHNSKSYDDTHPDTGENVTTYYTWLEEDPMITFSINDDRQITISTTRDPDAALAQGTAILFALKPGSTTLLNEHPDKDFKYLGCNSARTQYFYV